MRRKKFLTWLLAALCVGALSFTAACSGCDGTGEDSSVSNSSSVEDSSVSSSSSVADSSVSSSSTVEDSSVSSSSSVEDSSVSSESSSEDSSVSSSSSVEDSGDDSSSVEDENSSPEESSSTPEESSPIPDESLEYTLNKDGTQYAVTGIGSCKDTDVVIPSTYNGKPVTSIGERAFANCKFTSVTIGDGVTSIGGSAFIGCENLINVTIGKNVASIGNYAFYACVRITIIVIPDSVASIGDYAFSGCSSLASISVSKNNAHYKSVGENLYSKDGKTLVQYAIGKTTTSFTIPDGVTRIGGGAFYKCYHLTIVIISVDVTSIGDYAFSSCGNLTSITIPDGVTHIGERAFTGCENLTGVTIGKGVKSIGEYAFYGCVKLTIIVIPDSVASIGDYAFNGCENLTGVTIGKGVTSIGEYAFFGCVKLTIIYYKGTESDWKKISIDSNNSVLTDVEKNYGDTTPDKGDSSPNDSVSTPDESSREDSSSSKDESSHTHSYTQQVTDSKYLKDAATCTNKATYYYSCTCGATGTTTFEYGTALGHSYTKYNSDNNASCEKDGTKTASCDNGCGETKTIADEGSALGINMEIGRQTRTVRIREAVRVKVVRKPKPKIVLTIRACVRCANTCS